MEEINSQLMPNVPYSNMLAAYLPIRNHYLFSSGLGKGGFIKENLIEYPKRQRPGKEVCIGSYVAFALHHFPLLTFTWLPMWNYLHIGEL